MRSGIAMIVVVGLVAIAAVGGYATINSGVSVNTPLGKIIPKPTPSPSDAWDKFETIPNPKKTSPNNTSTWTNFYSELYGYSLRRPSNFRKVLGNEDLFQATSPDYLEEGGVVIKGAIAQTITSDSSNSFEEAWGDYGSKLEEQNIELVAKHNISVDGEKGYKIKIKNQDGTTEIRYLTYKSPYSYKTSILVGRDSSQEADKYEQILDDIISTFKF